MIWHMIYKDSQDNLYNESINFIQKAENVSMIKSGVKKPLNYSI